MATRHLRTEAQRLERASDRKLRVANPTNNVTSARDGAGQD
ncbi:hypothetical protein [Rhodopirellula baltica]|nr:hypothetical protein [Rhodopirellula baltica]